ncbi:MAG: outer membrane lipoprotein-sorting protein [Gammaproteobacteria bacterium]
MSTSRNAGVGTAEFLLSTLILLWSVAAHSIELPSDTPPAIKECVERMAPDNSLKQYVNLVSYDDSGIIDESAGNLLWLRGEDGLSKAIIRLSAPASRAGLAVLMHEQDGKKPKLYLYVPDLKRTRTVTGKQVATSMMGTDFSYEEFSYLQNLATDNTTTQVEDQDLDGTANYVFHTVPGDPEAAYTLIETFVDQALCVPVLTRFYNNDNVAKEMLVDRASIQVIKNRHVPHKVVMHDRSKNTRTELTAKDVEIDPGLDESMFHPKRLSSTL